ncbi:DUF3986 family protein [Bacillus hwajinpoensis]|uniref:DUF3986 family protein n=1 Tax=Guptibacillus hwajinpoensis TaxID=208199 RepID=A0A845EY95_9BACL|nr:DUF3986 family protein [Pseudalkalibacillus hwajinpoensis]MYL63488.1 DUF3986 family protein [Pseudalkalibacillus hwajinpoensis]
MYEINQHYHIGYYKEGCDFEVVAYKRKYEDIWDVFVEDYEPGLLYKYVSDKDKGNYVKNYGILIFSICDSDPSEEKAVQLFEDWLLSIKII